MRNRLLATAVVTLAAAGTWGSPAFAAHQDDSSRDTAFVTTVHQGNLAEIAAGNDAQNHATTDCVKAVGSRLVTDHTKLDKSLRDLAAKSGTTLPASPTPDQQQALKNLQAKAGTPAYDKGWLADQETAHAKTLTLIDDEIHNGKSSAVVVAAQSARPIVAMHLDMVRGGTCHQM